MTRKLMLFAVTSFLLVWSQVAHAQTARVPIQGVLSDAGGAPLTGQHSVQFAIYTTLANGDAIFTETQTLNVANGTFTAYLGAASPLNWSVFNGQDLYLGIKVGSDEEMSPRLQFGTVPYAAYARETRAVPAGAVMYFDLDQCPAGWTEFAAGHGRTLVGIPMTGTRVQIGTALADMGTRTINTTPRHFHDIPPHATSGAGNHTHSVDPAEFTTPIHMGPTTKKSGEHAHGGSTGSGKSTLDMCNHPGSYGTSYVQGSTTQCTGGPDISSNAVNTHTHPISTSGSTHQHTFDLPAKTSSSDGNHTHPIAAHDTSNAGATSVDVTMPYLQLLICRKCDSTGCPAP